MGPPNTGRSKQDEAQEHAQKEKREQKNKKRRRRRYARIAVEMTYFDANRGGRREYCFSVRREKRY